MKILIVDDDPVSRKIIQKTLDKAGYDTVTAEDGLIAWEIYQDMEINLIISDWMMPNMDGVTLCRKVRDNIKSNYVYFIMLTAKDKKTDLIEVFNSGADDYIQKPLNTDEIKARLKTGERIVKLEKEHKVLNNVLIESKNKLMTVFDSLTEEIISVDNTFRILSANKAFINETGISMEKIVNHDLTDILAEREIVKDNKSILSLLKKTFETGNLNFGLHNYKDEQGEIRRKEITYIPVKNKENRPVQVVISCRDITEDEKKTEEISQLNKKLSDALKEVESKNDILEETLKSLKETQAQILQSEKMSSIGQLAAGVAHEINNPTGFVSSNLKTLADYQEDINRLMEKYRELISGLKESSEGINIPDEINDLISNITEEEKEIDIEYIIADVTDLIEESREGADRIKKIVQDLKDFAHPGEDKLQTADINTNIESTLNIVWNELKYKATVHKELGDIPQVKCFPHQLNQVFMNLLVNAAQAIEKNGEIKIITKSVNNHVNIIISDTGSGIPPESLGKIFDPFFTTKEVGKGTGLGLNVVYNIIKKHNGTIDVDSEVGKGTTFTVSVPVGDGS